MGPSKPATLRLARHSVHVPDKQLTSWEDDAVLSRGNAWASAVFTESLTVCFVFKNSRIVCRCRHRPQRYRRTRFHLIAALHCWRRRRLWRTPCIGNRVTSGSRWGRIRLRQDPLRWRLSETCFVGRRMSVRLLLQVWCRCVFKALGARRADNSSVGLEG